MITDVPIAQKIQVETHIPYPGFTNMASDLGDDCVGSQSKVMLEIMNRETIKKKQVQFFISFAYF